MLDSCTQRTSAVFDEYIAHLSCHDLGYKGEREQCLHHSILEFLVCEARLRSKLAQLVCSSLSTLCF